jgi:hypothetical protein
MSRRQRAIAGTGRRNDGERWVTLSNHRRVLLDQDGRVARGLPGIFQRVHVRDLTALSTGVRQTEQEAQACERTARRRHPRTFRTSEEAVRALLDVNPGLVDFLEHECARQCDTYRAWIRRGRRGSKPVRHISDGRFDPIEIALELRGKRRISSWLEAVFVTVPPSRRWEDFNQRLQYLADATGLRLALPDPAERLQVVSGEIEHCQTVAAQRIQRLIELARAARLPGALASEAQSEDEEAPF